MFANYNNEKYLYISNRRTKEIVTHIRMKIDESFICDKGLFYKKITDEELTDIYDVEFWVKYESGFDNVSVWWKLGSDRNTVTRNHVTLIFSEGILPGWKIVEKNVCSTEVDIVSLSETKIKIIYKKKDGNSYQTPMEQEQKINVTELVDLHYKYCKDNI